LLHVTQCKLKGRRGKLNEWKNIASHEPFDFEVFFQQSIHSFPYSVLGTVCYSHSAGNWNFGGDEYEPLFVCWFTSFKEQYQKANGINNPLLVLQVNARIC
jgi:hypothetical protein